MSVEAEDQAKRGHSLSPSPPSLTLNETSSSLSSTISMAENQEATVEFSSLEVDNLNRDQEFGMSSPDNHLSDNLKNYGNIESGAHIKSKQFDKEDNMSQNSIDSHFTISWHKLNYVVESKWYKLASQRKQILNNLSGSFKSGELSAILGPSGAGKSTLIDCLLGKRERGLSGKTKVTFDNKLVEEERRKKRPLKIATIPQQDHLIDSLTVSETFMYASRIKNAHLDYNDEYEIDKTTVFDGKTNSSSGKEARKAFDHFANVQRVIKQLNLSSCASLRCGKLSGGQYKRVSIGQELLSRPDLMVLDEPTSGLDSVTCYQTIKALRCLIEDSPYPMAIVATIHQPDIEVFDLFHKAYVLATGGRAIYEGPTESIFDTVQLALKIVETRHSSPLYKLTHNSNNKRKSSKDWQEEENDITRCLLNKNLQKRSGNPARLIVELATNKYGYEITNNLADIQSREHFVSEISPYQSVSDMTATSTTSVVTLSDNPSIKLADCKQISPVASTSNDSIINQQNIIFNPDLSHISPPQFDYYAHDPVNRRADLDELICLAAANINRKRTFKIQFRHLIAHISRSWKTILRDPMLFTVQVLLHIIVPLLISYSFQGHKSDACPRVGTLDVINEAYRINGTVLDDLNAELRVAFENLGYMFFQVYVIIFAAVCVTSLTYPLVMHVLLKEYRNGWYSMDTYFIGRTLADLPVLIFNVVLAMAISYHLTGQPLSPYGWRFISVATVTVLATIVAQTWGLIFGALLMNAPQSAVFVAPASTAPLVVVSGFLIRIKSLPYILQIASKLSYFTYLLNGIIISRYGFNRCPCTEEDFSIESTHVIPQQARSIINIWVDTFGQEYGQEMNSNSSVDLVGKLVDTISRAKTFGFEMSNCKQVKPFTMLDYDLNDSDLLPCYIVLFGMLIFFRWLAYIVLVWRIRSSL